MKNLKPVLAVSSALLFSANTIAHGWNSSRPDSHAPISVMGDHIHKTGEFMLSYRHMRMEMDSLVDGDRSMSGVDLLENSSYMMAPSKMTMDMHMVGGMYAPSNQLTLMAMLPYHELKMDMVSMMHGSMGSAMGGAMNMAAPSVSTMESSGVGDLKLGALYGIYDDHQQKVHLNFSMSLPSGSIDEKNSNGQVLPYGMQLGSGTYDLTSGITYAAQHSRFSWGAQASALVRLGENDRDYTLGNRYQAQAWVQKLVHRRVSFTARIDYQNWQEIDGQDSELNPMMSPTADAELTGGERLMAGVGVNVTLPAGNRLAIEYNREIDQDLDGPQMALRDSWVLGWQLSF